MEPGSIVILHLQNPTEKLWGVLERLNEHGITMRGLNLSSFDDWIAQAAAEEGPPAIGLATMFVPMIRVERLFLDEQVGAVESYCQRFERRVGQSVYDHLGMPVP
ncbi:MAG TPA: hypothetical protein VMT85_16465 [Thermoanaerobaculia bacterium]|nr:hypothetical protein [Thermoanaerobaculia bacterium]